MRRRRQRLMSEINVVPYIDVMLVLLIIFMITAPLITQGVKIDLPQAPSEVVPPSQQEPVMITVDSKGSIFIDVEIDVGRDRMEPKSTLIDIVFNRL